MPTTDSLPQDIAEGIFEMHARLALRERNTEKLAEAMTVRALNGAEIGAAGRYHLFDAIRSVIKWEMTASDVRRIEGAR